MPKTSHPPMVSIEFRAPPMMRDQVEAAAEAHGIGLSELMRRIVWAHFDRGATRAPDTQGER